MEGLENINMPILMCVDNNTVFKSLTSLDNVLLYTRRLNGYIGYAPSILSETFHNTQEQIQTETQIFSIWKD